MKSVSTALAAHLAGPVTTLACLWRITRLDGVEFFTRKKTITSRYFSGGHESGSYFVER